MLGIEKSGHGFLSQLVFTFQHVSDTHLPTLVIALVVSAVIVGFDVAAPRFPGALLAVIGTTAASALFHWIGRGIGVVGAVPSGLPRIGLPGMTWSDISLVLPVAFSCFIVILAQSAGTSRAYALRYRDHFSQSVDLIGLSLANAAAGCSSTFVVNGSPTQNCHIGRCRRPLSMVACDDGGRGAAAPAFPDQAFELPAQRRARRYCLSYWRGAR
jgi:MFS superfamily sulfate permease-like transporter